MERIFGNLSMKKGKLVVGVVMLYLIVAMGIYCNKMNMDGNVDNDTVDEVKEEESVDISSALEETQEGVIVAKDPNTDIISRYALPSLERMNAQEQEEYVNNLQVIKRIRQLGLQETDFLNPENVISNIEEKLRPLDEIYYNNGKKITFEGTTSQELQQVIDNNPNGVIDIYSNSIELSNTIILHDNITLNGNGVKFIGSGLKYGFLAENASNVYIGDIYIDGGMEYGIYLIDCKNIKLVGNEINECIQKAICMVGETEGFILSDNKMSDNRAGALHIAGDASIGLIESNSVEDTYGTSNMMAGIVFTSDNPKNKRDIWDNFDDLHIGSYGESLFEQIKAPHNIIVRNNRVSHCNSSGIYSDGAYSCIVIGNEVKQNDKEGMCLDHGTFGFYLKGNVFEENGQRSRQTDDDLQLDFVLDFGRMEDGTAISKLPGISLDNTAYNILEDNMIINNYGGGIKMVRTTVRTVILKNVIRDNNKGQNDIYHFFGIEIGAAPSGIENSVMDFTPSYENIVCRNIITGDHYSGVFIAEECYVNDVFDNVIMDSQAFGVEAISHKFNSIINNRTNCGVRNEFG